MQLAVVRSRTRQLDTIYSILVSIHDLYELTFLEPKDERRKPWLPVGSEPKSFGFVVQGFTS